MTNGEVKISGYLYDPIYLYKHGDGYDLPKTVAAAIERGRDRWDDEPYLARVIFSEMIKDDIEGTIGYGIDTKSSDPSYLVSVDCENFEITVNDDGPFDFEQFVLEYSA